MANGIPYSDAENQTIIRMHHVEGWSLPSVAGELGRTAKSVRNQWLRLKETVLAADAPDPDHAKRACRVCGTMFEIPWWADFRRCVTHRGVDSGAHILPPAIPYGVE